MGKKLILLVSSALLFLSVAGLHARSFELRNIDTRVGTSSGRSLLYGEFNNASGENQGKTIPCVTEPHGMTFWTAQTRISEKKGDQPYYYRDTSFLGFRASHWLVGGATQDYGSFYVRPSDRSFLDHSRELSNPDYYAMDGCELTGRSRSAIMRMRGATSFTVGIINEYDEGYVSVDTLRREITGVNPVHRIYAGWGRPAGFCGYFVLRYASPLVSYVMADDGRSVVLEFAPGDDALLFKAGTSFTSIDAARENLDYEIAHWDFEQTRSELASIWEKALSVIEVKTDDADLRSRFYNSLWRSSLLPRTFSDVSGSYPSFGSPELKDDGSLAAMKPVLAMPEGKTCYGDFSMWDTFRALHPLLNIISPSVNADMAQSLVLMAEEGGWLPIFPCWGSYTSAMIGFHTVSMICDAWSKGVKGFDKKEAYRQMRKLAFGHPSEEEYADGKGIRALDSYEKYGYIPLEDSVKHAFHMREQSSRTLEYSYDDFVLSRVALRTLHFRDWVALRKRSHNWRNVFDPSTGYVQGRHADGSFLNDDNRQIKTSFCTEGTPMHYSWYVPHDMKGLQELTSAAGADFTERLDCMFAQGSYWHGNEPCHQVAYLYDYTDTPYKTQKLIRDILYSEYRNSPDGLSGNDDAGQMAAWFVFSAMGFYPVCPGGPARYDYAIGSPCFDELTIHLENGRTFTIKAEGTSDECRYIQDARLNGRRFRRHFLSHRDIARGGVLEFSMGPEPVVLSD